jgi:hypothetical protein
MRDDIARLTAAWDKKTAKKAKDYGQILEQLGTVLGDERALAIAPSVSRGPGTYQGATWGILCVGERRLVFVGRNGQAQANLDEITGLQIYPGRMMSGSEIEVALGPSGEYFEIETQSATGPLWSALPSQWTTAQETAKKARSGADPSPQASVADELGKLAELRAQGVLTDEEFEAQKTRLLA